MVNVLDCEMSVIGALLCSDRENDIQNTFHRISEKAFSDESLRGIYREIKALQLQTGKVDPVLLVSGKPVEMKQKVVACMEIVPSAILLPQYVEQMLDGYRRRILQNDILKILQMISVGAPTEEILRKLDKSIIIQGKFADFYQSTSSEMLASIIEFLNSLSKPEHKPVLTGFGELDRIIGGFQPKSINILSGRPGQGKSDFAVFLATALASNKTRVLYLSMEMPRVQIMARIAARIAQIDGSRIRNPDILTETERNTMAILLDKICKIPLVLDEQQELTVMDVQAKIRQHKPQIVFIDHMQLMAQENRYKQGWENLAETSRALKRLAVNENVIFVELVQKSPEAERRGRESSQMSDLKGTDVYTNDADTITFISATKPEKALSGGEYVEALLEVVKNRHGKTGNIKMHWQPQYHRYLPIDGR